MSQDVLHDDDEDGLSGGGGGLRGAGGSLGRGLKPLSSSPLAMIIVVAVIGFVLYKYMGNKGNRLGRAGSRSLSPP